MRQVVDIHIKAFPDHFMTLLGKRFLKVFYGNFRNHSDSLLLLNTSGSGCVGFVAGYLDGSVFFKRLKKQKTKLTIALLPVIFSNPGVIRRIIFNSKSSNTPLPPKTAELASLAVDPAFQGHGIGAKLVAEFEVRVQQNGFTAVQLTTDADGNDVVNRFYHKLGYRILDTYTGYGGRRMNLYRKELE